MAVCPECKFQNQARETVCLMCKAELPAGQDPPTLQLKRSALDARATDAFPAIGEEEPLPASSSAPAEEVDAAKIVGYLCCEPLAPIPIVPGASMTLGRSSDCTVVLRSKAISRKHAQIRALGQTLQLEDLGSANGTYLNGRRTPRAKLSSGDVITIGSYEIFIHSKDSITDLEDVDGDGTAVIEVASTTSGFLREGSLAELLQGMEFNEKTATLKILSGSLRGTILIKNGRPLSATLGGDRDEEAIFRMLALKEGRYSTSSALETEEASMAITVTGLLLEASRRIDTDEQPEAGVEEPEDSEPEPATEGADS